jgi:DNA-binding HxlR family transcriptional regulator
MDMKTVVSEAPFESSGRCSLERYLDAVSGAWTPRILWCLLEGRPYRFADLERTVVGISPKVLTQKLRNLERHQLVKRMVHASSTPHVEYSLTDRGWALAPVFRAMELAAVELFSDTQS